MYITIKKQSQAKSSMWKSSVCLTHPSTLPSYFVASYHVNTMSRDMTSDDRNMKFTQNRRMKCMPNWTLAYMLHVFSHCKKPVLFVHLRMRVGWKLTPWLLNNQHRHLKKNNLWRNVPIENDGNGNSMKGLCSFCLVFNVECTKCEMWKYKTVICFYFSSQFGWSLAVHCSLCHR